MAEQALTAIHTDGSTSASESSASESGSSSSSGSDAESSGSELPDNGAAVTISADGKTPDQCVHPDHKGQSGDVQSGGKAVPALPPADSSSVSESGSESDSSEAGSGSGSEVKSASEAESDSESSGASGHSSTSQPSSSQRKEATVIQSSAAIGHGQHGMDEQAADDEVQSSIYVLDLVTYKHTFK